MIFPSTYLGSLLLLVLSLFCMGTWAATQKMTVKWRFELFHFDLAMGLAVTAVAAAFTFGSMNPDELTFQDNFLLTGYRKLAWALISGAGFSLATMLLMGASILSRMSVAFPIAFALSLVIGAVWDYILEGAGSPVPVFSGVALLLITLVVSSLSFRWFVNDTEVQNQKAFIADPRIKTSAPKNKPGTSVVLAVISGLFMGVAGPVLNQGMAGDNGLSAYGAFLLFSVSFFGSSLLYIPFFLNFPVQGAPIQIRQYFKGTKKQHILGFLGGILLGTGILSQIVAAAGTPTVRVQPLLAYILNGSAAVLAALWGLLIWREFKGATSRVQMLVLSSLVLFLAGVAVIAVGRSSQ